MPVELKAQVRKLFEDYEVEYVLKVVSEELMLSVQKNLVEKLTGELASNIIITAADELED